MSTSILTGAVLTEVDDDASAGDRVHVPYGEGEICPKCDWASATVESRRHHDDHCDGYPYVEEHIPTYVASKGYPNLFQVFCSCGRSSYGSSLRDSARQGHLRHIAHPAGDHYRDVEGTERLLAIIGPIELKTA